MSLLDESAPDVVMTVEEQLTVDEQIFRLRNLLMLGETDEAAEVAEQIARILRAFFPQREEPTDE